MTNHQECYGKLFPSIENAEPNVDHKGKALSFRVERTEMIVPPRRVTKVDSTQWDECTQCAEFENCYQLSMARLQLEQAVRSYS